MGTMSRSDRKRSNRLGEPENPGPETLPDRRCLSVSFTEAVDGCGGPCPNGSVIPPHLRIDSHETTDAPWAEDASFLVTGQQVYRGDQCQCQPKIGPL